MENSIIGYKTKLRNSSRKKDKKNRKNGNQDKRFKKVKDKTLKTQHMNNFSPERDHIPNQLKKVIK